MILGLETGSPGRTRTSDPAVNSRLLYQLSYRGSLITVWPLTSRLLNVQFRPLYSIKPAAIPDTAALAAPAAGPVAPQSESWQVSASYGRIAQLVEQLTLNQRVLGSSPSAPTNLFNGLGGFLRSAETAVSHSCHKRVGEGVAGRRWSRLPPGRPGIAGDGLAPAPFPLVFEPRPEAETVTAQ